MILNKNYMKIYQKFQDTVIVGITGKYIANIRKEERFKISYVSVHCKNLEKEATQKEVEE